MDQEIYERLRKISERLKEKYGAEKVILYGSYATGEATEDSGRYIGNCLSQREILRKDGNRRNSCEELNESHPLQPVHIISLQQLRVALLPPQSLPVFVTAIVQNLLRYGYPNVAKAEDAVDPRRQG